MTKPEFLAARMDWRGFQLAATRNWSNWKWAHKKLEPTRNWSQQGIGLVISFGFRTDSFTVIGDKGAAIRVQYCWSGNNLANLCGLERSLLEAENREDKILKKLDVRR